MATTKIDTLTAQRLNVGLIEFLATRYIVEVRQNKSEYRIDLYRKWHADITDHYSIHHIDGRRIRRMGGRQVHD